MAHTFKIGRQRNLPDVVCDVGALTAPDGHLYTQDELDVNTIDNPDGSLSTIDWNKQAANKFRKNIWESIRTTGLGGSDIGILLGHSHFRNVLDLYYDKIGQIPVTGAPEPESSKEYLFDFGHAMEAFVAEQFCKRVFWDRYKESFETKLSEKYGEVVIVSGIECVRDTHMYRLKSCPCLLADFDFLCRLTLMDGRVLEGIFECKTTAPYQIAEKWTDAPPESYQDQIADYMLIGDYDFAIIACAADNNYNNYYAHLVFRDEDKDAEIVKVASDFWNKHVLAKKPPEISGDVRDAILTYEPTVNTSVIDFTKNGYANKQLQLYLEAKARKSEIQKELDAQTEKANEHLSNIAKLLRGQKGARVKAEDGTKYILSIEETEKESFTQKERSELFKAHPELKGLIQSFYKKTTSRSFKVKKDKQR